MLSVRCPIGMPIWFTSKLTDPDPVALASVGAIGAWYSAKERMMNGQRVLNAVIYDTARGVVIVYGMNGMEPEKRDYPALIPGWTPKPSKRELAKMARRGIK